MNEIAFEHMTIRELRARCQANAPEAGRDPLLGYTIRFFSIYVTKYIFLPLRLTPNWITVVSVTVFFCGMGLYFFDNLSYQLLGSFLIWFSVVLDGCDGEMARLRGNPSGVGSIYSEPVSHDIMYAFTFFPIAANLWLGGFPSWILIIAWIATTSKLLQRLFITRFDKVLESKGAKVKQSDGDGDPVSGFNSNVGFIHKLYRFINRNFFSSVGFVIPLTVSALIGHLEYFLYAFAVFFSSVTMLYFIRQSRAIAAFSRKKFAESQKTGA